MLPDEKFLENKVFIEQALTFDALRPEEVNGQAIVTGAIVQKNGDVVFRIYAPSIEKVKLTASMYKGEGTRQIELEKLKSGVHEATMLYKDSFTGPANINLYFDDVLLLYPYIPIYWSSNRPCNYIEIPEKAVEFMMIKAVAHGTLSREVYWTDVLSTWERCTVYTPPGYMKNDLNYPVLYLLNGGGDDEVSWQYTGRMAYILDNLIAEGEIEPFIVVMNNGMLRHTILPNNIVDDAFQRLLTESCIPFIERTYRVKTDKWSRAIAGLSMGSFMTCDIGFAFPELFGYMGHFTACMTEESLKMTYDRPFSKVLKVKDFIKDNYRVFYRSTTPLEDHFEYFEADDRLCVEHGIDKLSCYYHKVYSDKTTKWNSWRMGLRDFSKLIFKEP